MESNSESNSVERNSDSNSNYGNSNSIPIQILAIPIQFQFRSDWGKANSIPIPELELASKSNSGPELAPALSVTHPNFSCTKESVAECHALFLPNISMFTVYVHMCGWLSYK